MKSVAARLYVASPDIEKYLSSTSQLMTISSPPVFATRHGLDVGLAALCSEYTHFFFCDFKA